MYDVKMVHDILLWGEELLEHASENSGKSYPPSALTYAYIGVRRSKHEGWH